jgi:hypothetical protein
LVLRFGDDCCDAATAQVGAVLAGGVGLVADDGPGAGARSADRGLDLDLVQDRDEPGAVAGPCRRRGGSCRSGHPRSGPGPLRPGQPCDGVLRVGMRRGLGGIRVVRVAPPPSPSSAAASSRASSTRASRRMPAASWWARTDVESTPASDRSTSPRRAASDDHTLQDGDEHPGVTPLPKPVVDRLPGAEPPGHLPPLGAGTELSAHTLELGPQVHRIRSERAHRKERCDELPLGINQLRSCHTTVLPGSRPYRAETLSKITTPDRP